MEKVLEQDDCAPDALEYFIKNMKEKFNLDFHEMKKKGIYKVEDDDMELNWFYKGYTLSIRGDYPYYILYKE